MEKLYVSLANNSYEIYIEGGILSRLKSYLGKADQSVLITDDNVERIYGELLDTAMKGQKNRKIVVPAGEGSKNLSMAEKILSDMLDFGLTRNSLVIAVGGGVVGDLAGFCASIYMRGISYVQVPTTLLGQVDSSVGGKTGVNMPQGKNTIGTFHQPQSVVIDLSVLSTLPRRALITGIGEVIKYGVIYDYDFLKYVEENFEAVIKLQRDRIEKVIKRCCEIKTKIVAADEKEQGLRKILNFGHTVGHALEVLGNYEKYTHGEAVLIGMYYEALMAKNLGLIEDDYFDRIQRVIKKTGVSLEIKEFAISDLVEVMGKDKKNKEGKISFILPTGRGEVTEKLFSTDEIRW